LNTYYYQYHNLYIYEVWGRDYLRQLPLHVFGFRVIAFAFLLAAVGLVLLVLEMKKNGEDWLEPTESRKASNIGNWIAAGALLVGQSFVYVINGGYSLDSRKRYSVVFIIVLAAGILLQNKNRSGCAIEKITTGLLMILAIFDIPTTWVLAAARNDQIARQYALTEQSKKGDITDGIGARLCVLPTGVAEMWDGIWPPNITGLVLQGPNDSRVHVTSDLNNAIKIAVWQSEKGCWCVGVK